MADSSTFAVLNLGSQRVSGAVFGKTRSGGLVLKQVEFAEMFGDPSVDATRLPQMRVALLELTEKLRLKGRSVWYSIAGHVVFTRFVKLPPFQDDKADQIVEFEARQNVPFPINEVIWDYEFIGEKVATDREVALVAIKADALNDINDQIEDNGIKVAGVDLAPLAAFNAFRYSYPDVAEPTLLIDLGSKSTNLIFIEGDRVFTRNILVGGCTVTGNIAKELSVNFGEAEDQKRSKGYVAPGGAYEAHEDETMDAISKIMRNTLSRLHGEIVRTINYYRSQQGGSPPRRIFLCGGGAQTAMVTDFFTEKFNLPVEVFNPMRGVALDSRLDSASVDSNAPSMAELVGLALRHAGSAPVEVELIPDTVAHSRDSARRAPFLVMAAACLFAVLALGGFYYQHSAELVRAKLSTLSRDSTEMKKQDTALKKLDQELTILKAQSAQLEDAVKSRGYWNHLLALLNNKFVNDYVWLTQMEVLKDGSSITPLLSTGGALKPSSAAVTGSTAAKAKTEPHYELRLQGLYRKNDQQQQVVYKYYEDLKASSEFFTLPPPEQKPSVETDIEDARYASKYNFRLPLVKDSMKFEK